jgi:hypothetical protein
MKERVAVVLMDPGEKSCNAEVYLDVTADMDSLAAAVLRAALKNGASVERVLMLCADAVAEVA